MEIPQYISHISKDADGNIVTCQSNGFGVNESYTVTNKYIAHSANSNGREQTMKEHSDGVAKIMMDFALTNEFVEIYLNCAKLHDAGKYSEEFQKYIRGNGEKEPHAKWGAYIAQTNKMINVAFPIIGHHAGLPNRDAMFETLKTCEKENQKFKNILKFMREDDTSLYSCDNTPFDKIHDVFQKELFVRLLYSSLVDADSLDTERHFSKEKYDLRHSRTLNVDVLLSALNRKFTTFKKRSTLNGLRTKVRLYAQGMADKPLGCYSMTLPTGMGKTLCSLNWALHHAKAHHNINRIVIVLPFLSIIDQTANELKSIFNDYDVVLEHHSNVIYEGQYVEEKHCVDYRQLATENWDYPIIVTTAVQFF